MLVLSGMGNLPFSSPRNFRNQFYQSGKGEMGDLRVLPQDGTIAG
jgi:hypothetical protein